MSADVPSSSQNEENKDSIKNRMEMVQTARQFLQNPRVRGTLISDQRKFLSDKGLKESEIDEAFESLSTVQETENLVDLTSKNKQSSENRLFNTIHSAVVVGGATYMVYKFFRSWILPKFFDIPDPEQEQIETLQTQLNDLQNSQKFVLDTVMRTLDTVSIQQDQLNRAQLLMSSSNGSFNGGNIEKLHTDIGIIKSLLLNQNQFPPIPENFKRSVENEIVSPFTQKNKLSNQKNEENSI